MADDLDDLLRRAMKSLDDQVPSGYFEDLPARTLARLDSSGDDMQTSSTNREGEASSGAPLREEDSGLHDIKNLAQTTKQRLSSQKIPTRPSDDDVLASSSAGWKAVALPAPASAVSLPAIDDLPSKKELKKRAEGSVATAVPAPEQATPIGAAIAAKPAKRRGKGPAIALVGVGLAAAAGAVIFVSVRESADRAPAAMDVERAAPAPAVMAPAPAAVRADLAKNADKAQAQNAAAIATDSPVDAGVGAAAAAGSGAVVDQGAAKPEPVPQKFAKPPTKKPVDKAKGGKKTEPDAKPVKEKIDDASKKQPAVSETKKPASGDANFDDLLKEAGVNQKKDDRPKLDKKELTKDDFTRGIGAVAGAAGKCYQGKQGTAAVKIVIAPNGRVQKVTVTGEFAGTPVASCVTSAVKGATFPAWDGGPQSFNYSFLLSE